LLIAEWYYIDGLTVRELGIKTGTSYNTVSIRIQNAESFIDGILCALDIRLEMDGCKKENIIPPKSENLCHDKSRIIVLRVVTSTHRLTSKPCQ
jgi:hypothetical protein